MNKRTMKTAVVALVLMAIASPGWAQNKREMQMMADIRMLQEQNQQLQVELQAAIASLNDTLKMINGRVDEQAAATRKGFADQALKVDQFASELRVVREGISENNVRVAQVSQEVEALRLSIPQPGYAAPPLPPDGAAMPGAPNAGAPNMNPAGSVPPPAPLGPGVAPQRLFDTARADYYAGQWDLCVSGFDTYLRTFPKSELAHEAQYYIGECYASDSKWQDAVTAYNQVIGSYPRSSSAANAYYKRGDAFERLGQTARARESYESVIKSFPESDPARLAKQRLDRLNRGKQE